MDKAKLKQEVDSIFEDLPDNVDWNDLMYSIYVRQSIEQGLEDVRKERIVAHEEIKTRYQRTK